MGFNNLLWAFMWLEVGLYDCGACTVDVQRLVNVYARGTVASMSCCFSELWIFCANW